MSVNSLWEIFIADSFCLEYVFNGNAEANSCNGCGATRKRTTRGRLERSVLGVLDV